MSRKLAGLVLLSALLPGAAPRLSAAAVAAGPFLPLAADSCADAPVISDGTYSGDTSGADSDGASSCDDPEAAPDVWWHYVAPADGTVVAQVVETTYSSLLSVHSSCPGTAGNEIVCSVHTPGRAPKVTFDALAGEEVWIRASGFGGAAGSVNLGVSLVGAITGTVTRASTGEPLAGATVSIVHGSGNFTVASATTNAAGSYAAGGLLAGTYYARAALDGFLGELWEEIRCDGCTRLGKPIQVLSGATVSGIDFTLEVGGYIAGTVKEAESGEPLAARIDIFDADGNSVSGAFTDAAGEYVSDNGLEPGTYFVATRNFSGFVDELYDDIPCRGGALVGCAPTAGTPVTVTPGATTAGIDFDLDLDLLGGISGTVVASTGGLPVFAKIEVHDAGGSLVSSTTTEQGVYTAGDLEAGTYFVTTRNFVGYLDELFDDVPCPGGGSFGCDPTDGTPVEVAASTITGGIDFELVGLGSITGTVTAEDTGLPIAGINVEVHDHGGVLRSGARTDSAGRYFVQSVGPGTHFAATRNSSGYFDEIYDDKPCRRGPPSECRVVDGTPIEVRLEETTAGIDFALAVNGSLSGRVTDQATGQGIAAVEVQAWNTSGVLLESGSTDASGFYSVINLDPGTYFATTSSAPSYLDELFDDMPCPEIGPRCRPTRGTPIDVTLSADSGDIDFALERLGAVVGTVTDSATGLPLAGIEVRIWNVRGAVASSGTSGESGSYSIEGLVPGTYFATTASSFYRDQLYDGRPCTASCDPTDGTPIAVELAAATTGVDFALALAAGIQGTVTDGATGTPLPGVFVDVWDAGGSLLRRAVSGAGGRYSVGLGDGVYFLSTNNELGAVDEVYDNVACPEGPAVDGLCDVLSGAPVVVRPSTVVSGVDFALGDATCGATPTALCLHQGRFRVEVVWQDPQGRRGRGRGVELTSDSGYFWFFSADNVELIVKLLDGCFAPFDSFWVFAAGLTNVRVELTVTDTVTGAVKRYVNPLGAGFEPILDTAAFATCDAGSASAAARPRTRSPAPAAGKGASCSPGRRGLCLSDGRFLVETSWRTPEERTGEGTAVELTADTGYFWFFSPDNVEAVVKVLDACDLEPFHTYWVFAAGLTDVEATLRVTDTVSGAVREYKNPLGRPFRPVLDTMAFATCPE